MIVRVELRGFEPAKDGRHRGVVARLAAHLPEAACVPELVAEIFSALDPLLLEPDVLTLRRNGNDAETQSVGAILVDEIERVRRIAERLRHFAADRITDDAGKINVPK